jgi:hypothetical protein
MAEAQNEQASKFPFVKYGIPFLTAPTAAPFQQTPPVDQTIANRVPSNGFLSKGQAKAFGVDMNPNVRAARESLLRSLDKMSQKNAEDVKDVLQKKEEVRAITAALLKDTDQDKNKQIDTTIQATTPKSSTSEEKNVPAIRTGALTTGAPNDISATSNTPTQTYTSSTFSTTPEPTQYSNAVNDSSSFFNYNYGGYYAPKQKKIR